jgi:hypothetical protein
VTLAEVNALEQRKFVDALGCAPGNRIPTPMLSPWRRSMVRTAVSRDRGLIFPPEAISRLLRSASGRKQRKKVIVRYLPGGTRL